MIKGLGIDAVDIARFIPWVHYSRSRLARIFSVTELDYCFAVAPFDLGCSGQTGTKDSSLDTTRSGSLTTIAQRLAVRFAAREAFFKALSGLDPSHTVPFLTVCRHLAVIKHRSGAIGLSINWSELQKKGLAIVGSEPIVHVSATHTATTALVTVILETNND